MLLFLAFQVKGKNPLDGVYVKAMTNQISELYKKLSY